MAVKTHSKDPNVLSEKNHHHHHHHRPSPRFLLFQRRVFLLTYLAYASIYFTRKPFSLVKSALQRDLGFSKRDLGQIDTGFLLAYAIGQFMTGAVGDVWGARRVLAVGFLGSAVATVAVGGSSDLLAMTALWSLNGFCQSCAFPLVMKALGPWFSSKERGAAFGLWTTCQQIGSVGANASAAYLLATSGWRYVFFYPSLWVACCGLLLLLCLVDDPRDVGELPAHHHHHKHAEGHHHPPAAPRQRGVLEVARIPGLLNLGMAYFVVKLVRYTMLYWLPYYLETEAKYDNATAGYMSTLLDIGGAVGSVACGFLSDRVLGGHRLLVVTPMVLVAGLCAVAYGPACRVGLVANGVVMFVLGFMVAGPDSVLGGAATTDVCERANAPECVGSAAGITNGIGSVGAVLQGLLTAVLVDAYGWDGLFSFLAALCVLALLALLTPTLADLASFRAPAVQVRPADRASSLAEPLLPEDALAAGLAVGEDGTADSKTGHYRPPTLADLAAARGGRVVNRRHGSRRTTPGDSRGDSTEQDSPSARSSRSMSSCSSDEEAPLPSMVSTAAISADLFHTHMHHHHHHHHTRLSHIEEEA